MPLLIILPLPNISKNGRLAPLITIFIFQLQFAETQEATGEVTGSFYFHFFGTSKKFADNFKQGVLHNSLRKNIINVRKYVLRKKG